MIARTELTAGIVAGFTDRGSDPSTYAGNLGDHVGDDEIAVDRRRSQLLIDTGATRLCFVRQVHGADVVRIGAQLPVGVVAINEPADALVTTDSRSALAVLTADCLPVLLADPVAQVIGAAHAGRPGLVAGVLPAAVDAMSSLGAVPARIVAVLGPAICGGCYEVPEALRAAVDEAVPGTAATTTWGTPSVDLRAGATRQLVAVGLTQISHDARCTREAPELPSYRRDGTTGRLAGWIMVA